jgi:hypothetical protein
MRWDNVRPTDVSADSLRAVSDQDLKCGEITLAPLVPVHVFRMWLADALAFERMTREQRRAWWVRRQEDRCTDSPWWN